MRNADVRLERLENSRIQLEQLLQGYSAEQLNKTPPPGGWSPAEVLKHILDVESATLSYCVHKLQKHGAELKPVGFREKRNAFLLRLALRSPLRFRVPSALPEVKGPYDADALLRQWTEVRERYREFVRSYPPALEKAGLFRHPRSGMLSLEQTLAFLQAHLNRHLKQLKRALPGSA
ncbi:MAG: DinB family protein [Bacteroidia bacterium]|nr:DinB family protein [Bacteroidia bacterium]